MVQRQIDTFFKKRTYTTPKKIVTTYSPDQLSRPIMPYSTSQQPGQNENSGMKPSIQRSLFSNESSQHAPSTDPPSLLGKRPFSQISKDPLLLPPLSSTNDLQMQQHSQSPEFTIKKYFKTNCIVQSRTSRTELNSAVASDKPLNNLNSHSKDSLHNLSQPLQFPLLLSPQSSNDSNSNCTSNSNSPVSYAPSSNRRYEDSQSQTFFNIQSRFSGAAGDDSRHLLISGLRSNNNNFNNSNLHLNGVNNNALNGNKSINTHSYDSWCQVHLPVDVLMTVFCFLSVREIVHVISATSQQWRNIASKVLKNYHCYFHEFQLSRLSVAEYEYLSSKSELTHVKYITKLFTGQHKAQQIFNQFFLSCMLSPDYNQSKPDKMFAEIIIESKDRTKLKPINVKPLKLMLEHSKNSIKVLCLRYLHLYEKIAMHIPSLRELEQLYLNYNSDISDSIVQSICSRCKNLKVLQLSNCMNITDTSVECISSITQLTTLDLSYNSGIAFSNIHKLRRNKYLKSLSLRATSMKCTHLEILLANLPAIRRLNIDECRQLNFLAAQVLIQFIPKSLRILSIDKNNYFSEPQIFEIVEKVDTITKIKATSNCTSTRVQQRMTTNRYLAIFTALSKATNRTTSSAFQAILNCKNPLRSRKFTWSRVSFEAEQ